MYKTYSRILSDVHDASHLQEFALDPSMAKEYNDFVKYAFVKQSPHFNLLDHAEDTGKRITYTPWKDVTKPITYELAGEVVKLVKLLAWTSNNQDKPGYQTTIDVTFSGKLFSETSTIFGPSGRPEGMVTIQELGPGLAGGYTYRCVPFNDHGYVEPSALTIGGEWKFFSGTSSFEGSVSGPDSPHMGVTTRQTFMHDIRVSTHIGGALEDLQVNVYELGADNKTGEKSVKMFATYAEEQLRLLYAESKYNVLNWGENMNKPRTQQLRDAQTKEILREADGLYRQRGTANLISMNTPHISVVIETAIARAVSANRNITRTDLLVTTGTYGYSLALKQLRQMYGANVTQNVNAGDMNATLGYKFATCITDEGFRLTVALDTTLDTGAGHTIRMDDGSFASSHEWHVTNVGENALGKPSYEYYYVPSKHDLFVAAYGMRHNGVGNHKDLLLPNVKADIKNSLPNSNMVDRTEFSMAGTFVLVDTDPHSSFTVRPSIKNIYNY